MGEIVHPMFELKLNEGVPEIPGIQKPPSDLTSRTFTSRLRPPCFAGGICGSSKAHIASLGVRIGIGSLPSASAIPPKYPDDRLNHKSL